MKTENIDGLTGRREMDCSKVAYDLKYRWLETEDW
jgi:hypothetical protein